MRDVTTERTTFRQPMYGGVLNTDRKSPSPSPNSTPRDKLKVSPGSPQQEAQMKVVRTHFKPYPYRGEKIGRRMGHRAAKKMGVLLRGVADGGKRGVGRRILGW